MHRRFGGGGQKIGRVPGAGHAGQTVGQGGMALVELEEPIHHAWGVVEGGAQLLHIWGVAGKDRIAHGRAQFGDAVFLAVAQQIAPIHAVSVGDGDKNLHREGPLIAFQQIDIGRADAQPFGHARLGFFMRSAQLAQLRADKCFAHKLYTFTIVIDVKVILYLPTPFQRNNLSLTLAFPLTTTLWKIQ